MDSSLRACFSYAQPVSATIDTLLIQSTMTSFAPKIYNDTVLELAHATAYSADNGSDQNFYLIFPAHYQDGPATDDSVEMQVAILLENTNSESASTLANEYAAEIIYRIMTEESQVEVGERLEEVMKQIRLQSYPISPGSNLVSSAAVSTVAVAILNEWLFVADEERSRAFVVRGGVVCEPVFSTPNFAQASPLASTDVEATPIHKGDVIMLCSASVGSCITKEEIEEVVSSNNLNRAANMLISLVYGRTGARDASVVLLRLKMDYEVVTRGSEHPQVSRTSGSPAKRYLVGATAVAVAIFLWLVFLNWALL